MLLLLQALKQNAKHKFKDNVGAMFARSNKGKKTRSGLTK